MKIYPIILCGGSGSRLWPLSNAYSPKQFLSFFGDKSIFQETILRMQDAYYESPIIVCNARHETLLKVQLSSINIQPHLILLEPVSKNTAPAIITAAQYVSSVDENGMMVVLPSDHLIKDAIAFKRNVQQAVDAAMQDYLVTFGIKPDRPETGYGYIRRGEHLPINDKVSNISTVQSFTEKPEIEIAQTYLKSKEYYWNSGIFIFSAKALLSESKVFLPDAVKQCSEALRHGRRENNKLFLNEKHFNCIDNISIDYGVMEKAHRVAMVEVDFNWSDLGSYQSLWEVSPKDRDKNTVNGNAVIENSHSCYVFSDRIVTAVTGVHDLAIIATQDAVLVADREKAQEIKTMANRIADFKATHKEKLNVGIRPWGSYQVIDQGVGFQVKRIIVNPGGILSLQKHQYRSEHWVITQGEAQITKGEKIFLLQENQSTYIPPGEVHRLENTSSEPLHVIEVQCGEYLGEDDIERLEDVYGRCE